MKSNGNQLEITNLLIIEGDFNNDMNDSLSFLKQVSLKIRVVLELTYFLSALYN
jgi:hypothetical protein